MVSSILLTKLTYILGITNIVFGILILLSCRCMAGKFIMKLYKYQWYQKFYRYHCYYWWVFILSVFAHAILAINVFGNPF